MRTLKIFLASSAELQGDREIFRNFIGVENDRLHKDGIYLQLVQWEHFLDAMSETRLQDEYNGKLKACDLAVYLFFTKAGKFTKEEFDIAHDTFKATGKPRIWTYFKNVPINLGSITEEIISLLSFKKYLQELGHFPTHYDNVDFLQLHFKRQLEEYLQLTVEPPVVAPKISTQSVEQQVKKVNKVEILSMIDQDTDKALMTLDDIFLNKNGTYNDLSREYINQPNNFSMASFRSKMRRFVTMNLS